MNETSPFGTYSPEGYARRLIELTLTAPDTWIGRRTAYFLRRLGLSFLKNRPVDVERFGARMRLYPYHNVCEKKILFTPQYFDQTELNYLGFRIDEKRDEEFCFVDIGANIGAYSLFVAKRAAKRARILAVEPQPELFDHLVFNAQLNSEGGLKAVSCAVADKTGELTLFLDVKDQGQSSVRIVGTVQSGSIRVPSVTLIELLKREEFHKVDAIKLDVEGAEDIILEPFFRDAPETLHPTLILLEDSREQWQSDIPNILEQKGYTLKAKTRLNLIYEK